MATSAPKIVEPVKDRRARRGLLELAWPSSVRDLIGRAADSFAWGVAADEMMTGGLPMLGEALNVMIRNGVDVTPRRVEAAIVFCRRVGDEATRRLAPKPVEVVRVDPLPVISGIHAWVEQQRREGFAILKKANCSI